VSALQRPSATGGWGAGEVVGGADVGEGSVVVGAGDAELGVLSGEAVAWLPDCPWAQAERARTAAATAGTNKPFFRR
jgi:hypothetical protein